MAGDVDDDGDVEAMAASVKGNGPLTPSLPLVWMRVSCEMIA